MEVKVKFNNVYKFKIQMVSFYMCMYLCKLYPRQNIEYFQLSSRLLLYHLSDNNYFFPGGNHHFDLYYHSWSVLNYKWTLKLMEI